MKVIRIIIAAALFLLVIPLGLLYIGRSLDPYLFPSSTLQSIHLFGVPILFAGLLLAVISIWQLYSFGSGMPWGDVAEDSQSSRLVTKGLYAYTRNPMFLGYGIFMLGLGLYCGSFASAFIMSMLFVTFVSIWVKTIEEPKLVKRFGQEYIKYKEETPFMIPRISRKH